MICAQRPTCDGSAPARGSCSSPTRATCSTAPTDGWSAGSCSTPTRASARPTSRPCSLRLTPDPSGNLRNQVKLALLRVLADRVARAGRGEATLGRERKLVAGVEAGRLFDPADQLLGRFELVELRGDEAEHDDLVVGKVLERLE